jgi:hypothetical protein
LQALALAVKPVPGPEKWVGDGYAGRRAGKAGDATQEVPLDAPQRFIPREAAHVPLESQRELSGDDIVHGP